MKTVLVVDDDPGIRKFIRKVLEKENLTIVEASDGHEGLKLFRDNAPTVVLIDVIMPEMDGLAAIEEMKRIDGQSRIVAMSGGLVLIPQAYLDEASNLGADHTLAKPIDRQQLVKTIRACLN